MDNIIALGINKNQSWVHSDLDHMSGSVSDGSVSEVDCEIQLSLDLSLSDILHIICTIVRLKFPNIP